MANLVNTQITERSLIVKSLICLCLITIGSLVPTQYILQSGTPKYVELPIFQTTAVEESRTLVHQGNKSFSPLAMRMNFRVQISRLPSDPITLFSTNPSPSRGVSIVLDGAGFLNLNVFSSAFPPGQVQQIRLITEMQPQKSYRVRVYIDRKNAIVRADVEEPLVWTRLVFWGQLADPYHIDITPQSLRLGGEGFGLAGGSITEFSTEWKYERIAVKLSSLRALLFLCSVILALDVARKRRMNLKEFHVSRIKNFE